MSQHRPSNKTFTTLSLAERKVTEQKITVLTAYDATTAGLLAQAGVDILLVGDSLAMTVLGHTDTLSVTMDEMLHHTRAVHFGLKNAQNRPLLLADAPFMSYHVSVEQTVANMGRFFKEAGADAVKLEGATPLILQSVERLTELGMPVVGHLGLTPQAVKALGGFKLQAKTAESALLLLQNALKLEAAGCCALVLELIPAPVAELISSQLSIPTIGIGAGPGCDGQVLVIDDLLGRFEGFTPKFVRQYGQLGELTREAASQYCTEVQSGVFPSVETESFAMPEAEWQKLQSLLASSQAVCL